MSVKAPRGLTHGKQLYAPEVWIQRIARCWHELGDRRGVLLVQLPPAMARDDARLDYFLSGIPDWIDVAVELRHHSWHCEPVFELLARHRAAYVVLSGARLPCVLRTTAQTVYVRLHGPDHDHLYAGSYSDADLALVGGPDPGVARWRPERLCLLQQRRSRSCRAERGDATQVSGRLRRA